jgi:hypothetical protein
MSDAHAKFGWRGWVALLGIYVSSLFVVGSLGGLENRWTKPIAQVVYAPLLWPASLLMCQYPSR